MNSIPLFPAFARLDQTIASLRAYYRNPAMALAISDKQQVLHANYYGFSSLETSAPVTEKTLFEIGSIGKCFTAIAILQAQEAGLLKVDDPITAYLPWFRVQSTHEPIRLQHLLTHSAGIVAGTDACTDPRGEVYALRNTPGNRPGRHFYYSNSGYKALGLVLEAVHNQPYGKIIEKGILEPLEMNDSRTVIRHDMRPRMARGYLPVFDDRPAHRSYPLEPAPWLETNSGDGSIAATALDMARFSRMLLQRGKGPNGRLLSEASYRQLTQRWIRVEEGRAYGYGLFILEVDGRTIIGHGGDMPGYEAALYLSPDDKLAAVILMATPHVPRLALYALNLTRAALNQQALPEQRRLEDPCFLEQAGDYAGLYQCGEKSLTLEAEDSRVWLARGQERIPLEAYDEDQLLCAHPDFNRHLFRFGREDGRVVELFHGPDWYTNEQYRGGTQFVYPAEWTAFTGHYRSHNPWMSNFRVLVRKGRLLLAWPDGREEGLTPVGQHTFSLEDETGSPERLQFDWLVGGQTLRATLSGCCYDRFFTE